MKGNSTFFFFHPKWKAYPCIEDHLSSIVEQESANYDVHVIKNVGFCVISIYKTGKII